MKSKKIIRLIFSLSAYLTLMSFFGCEKEVATKEFTDLQHNIVSTLTFAINQ